ncbi:hypothetical protein AGMMS50284_3600 [Clostridia bacterium]|nr:hypothetical protein AGMMS50284_3600 [Clostridia bacterium]
MSQLSEKSTSSLTFRRFISILLSALMMVSLFAVGGVPTAATGETAVYLIGGPFGAWGDTTSYSLVKDDNGIWNLNTGLTPADVSDTYFRFKVHQGASIFDGAPTTNSTVFDADTKYSLSGSSTYKNNAFKFPVSSDTTTKLVFHFNASWQAWYTLENIPDTKIYVEPRAGYTDYKIFLFGGGSSAGWPGDSLNYDSNLNLYYRVVENASAKVAVVVSNNGSLQYPPSGTDIYAEVGSTMILRANNTWEEYVPVAPTEAPTLAPTVAPTTAVPTDAPTLAPTSAPTEDSTDPPFTTKADAFLSGLWIDTQADIIDSSIALVKWYNKSAGVYHLYIPAGVKLTKVPVYHKYSNLSINAANVTSGSNVNFSDLTADYVLTGDVTGVLKVYQSASPSVYLKTEKNVSYINATKENKDSGAFLSIKANGKTDQSLVLSQIKGRGTASWDASAQVFGKYAYNIKLDSAEKVFGMTKSKKWCLLANNTDESLVRNMTAFGLAAQLGLDFSPQFTTIDLYDNSEYLGNYLITEKIDVGKNNLLKITDLDDANVKANPTINIEEQERVTTPNLNYINFPNNPADITGGYVLEFELDERYDDSICGFISNQGQQVALKAPEYISYNEASYISGFFNEAEKAIYSANGINPDTGKHFSEYIDVESFAKMYLLQELTETVDAGAASYYIYKESDTAGDGKLHAAPVWDYEWSMGQNNSGKVINKDSGNLILKPDNYSQWWAKNKNIYQSGATGQYVSSCTGVRNFQAKLTSQTDFWSVVKTQWLTDFYPKALTLVGTSGKINEYFALNKDSVAMNEARWGFIANNPFAAGGNKHTGDTQEEAVTYLDDWVTNRLTWLYSQPELQEAPTPTEAPTEAPTPVPTVPVYLTGWLNGGAVTGAADDRKFTYDSATEKYTLTYTFTGEQGGSQYATIKANGTYYVAAVTDDTANPATLVSSSYTDSDANNAKKVKVSDASTGSTIIFTWDNVSKTLSYTTPPPPPFSKGTAFSSGFWIDTQPSLEDTSVALVKWYSKSSTDYRLYVPSGVDLTTVTVYHRYASLTINGVAVVSGSQFNLSNLTSTYTLAGSVTGNLKVYQSKSDSMYLETEKPVSYINASKDNKDSGTFLSVKANGTRDQYQPLAQIKGRGNSTWDASVQIFHKHAYNIKLDSAVAVLGLPKSKKWSLLANNVDDAQVRNMVAYGLGAAIGLDFTPQFKSVDIYDNSEYLGTYLFTEKVDVGKNNLMKITDLDGANADANPGIDISSLPQTGSSGLHYVNIPNDPSDITGAYVLEFELDERYDEAISGFISTQGQQVTLKAPESISFNEATYIKNFFNAAEKAVYSSNGYNSDTGKHFSDYIDVDSFAKMYLLQELTENIDAGATSYYIYKESDLVGDGKLHAAPVWDYDWTMGQYYKGKVINKDSGDLIQYPDNYSQWWAKNKNIYQTGANSQYSSTCTNIRNFQAKLCSQPGFWNVVKYQWNTDFYPNALNLIGSSGKIYEYFNGNKDSVTMNESRWGFIASNPLYTWGNKHTGNDQTEAVAYLDDWVTHRLAWLNNTTQGLKRTDNNAYINSPLTGSENVDVPFTDVNNGVYSTTFSHLQVPSPYPYHIESITAPDGGWVVNTKYDESLSTLNGIATVGVSYNFSLKITLTKPADVTVYYDSVKDKIYVKAVPFNYNLKVTYGGNDDLAKEKTVVVSSGMSDSEIKQIVVSNAPKLATVYYDYSWSASDVAINATAATATVAPTKTQHLFTITVKYGDTVIDTIQNPYQLFDDGEVNPNAITTLDKSAYTESSGFEAVEWYTVDTNAEELVLSSKDVYKFYTTKNTTIYVRESENTVKDYSATIFNPVYANSFTENAGVVTEKVTFKFPVLLTSPNNSFAKVTHAGILLVECSKKGVPKEKNLQLTQETLVNAASGTTVKGISNYNKAGAYPNSQGDFIYEINIVNNEANAERYFLAYGCFTVTGADGKPHTYVSENSVMASIALKP